MGRLLNVTPLQKLSALLATVPSRDTRMLSPCTILYEYKDSECHNTHLLCHLDGPAAECDALAETLCSPRHGPVPRHTDVVSMHLVEQDRRQIVGATATSGPRRWKQQQPLLIFLSTKVHYLGKQ